ncbi:MAG: DUF1571 domain-containing protein [Gemmataceae bacterium]|nr:DUF1571 domain-containing protein [Gemmataceae bacterium]
MTRPLLLVALAVALAGCNRPTYRGQSPFAKKRPATPPESLAPTGGGYAPLAPTPPPNPLPPAPPDGFALVPARPPEPGGVPNPGVDTPGSPGPAAALAPRNPGADAPGSPKPDAPAAPSPAAVNLAALKKLADAAAKKWQTVDTYEAHLTRREVTGAAAVSSGTEEVLFRYRKDPVAVYMKNVGPKGKGREILWSPKETDDKIQCIIGDGDTRLLAPGSKAPPQNPDSPRVRSMSRHSIREVGFGNPVSKFAAMVAKIEAGKLPPDALKSTGNVRRPEYGDHPLDGVEQTIKPGEDPALDRGGVRQWFFDAKPDSPGYGLPVLMILFETTSAGPKEVEYYCFTQLKLPAGLTAADFDPARLGKAK